MIILITSVKPTEEVMQSGRRVFMSVYGLTYKDQQRIAQTLPAVVRTVPVLFVGEDFGEQGLRLGVS